MEDKLDNKEQKSFSDKSLNKMSDHEIANKFEEQMDHLKNIAEAEAKDREKESDDLDLQNKLDEIDKFFDVEKKEFSNIDNNFEANVLHEYSRISDRNMDVQQSIKSSGESVLSEIQNWQKEKHPVAQSLLRIANWILGTEK